MVAARPRQHGIDAGRGVGPAFDVFELPGEPDLSICTYGVEDGTESADKLALLASWAATQDFAGRHDAGRARGLPPAGANG